ncbi:hypothetical protein KPL70_010986 [Citrus sinensis]|nr:hypothetical protein KPL70_010986 [Citrus sinensis]
MMLNLLPREILFEILSLLPVKFLPRVKCLCKALLCLILDPIFANVLASRGPKILISSSSGLKSLDCSKASFTFQRALTNLNFPPSYDKIINFSSIEIEGSCNGLVVCATIASSRRHCCDPDSDYRYCILATKTDSWRELIYDDRLPQCSSAYCSHYDLPQGSLLNGTLHWLIDCYHSSLRISAFDLKEEQFSELPMPKIETPIHFRTFVSSRSVHLFSQFVTSWSLCIVMANEGIWSGVKVAEAL